MTPVPVGLPLARGSVLPVDVLSVPLFQIPMPGLVFIGIPLVIVFVRLIVVFLVVIVIMIVMVLCYCAYGSKKRNAH